MDLNKILSSFSISKQVDFGHLDYYVNELQNAMSLIRDRYFDDSKDGNDHKELGWKPAYTLSKALDEFKTILSAECRSLSSYTIQKVGIYYTNDLIEKPENKFSDHVRSNINKDALIQFKEAAQCLSFRLYTACGYHMMRSVEYVFLDLMKCICGRKFDSLNTNWGAYINEMQKIVSSNKRRKPSKETIDLLRQIKDNHRNPVMHADVSLAEHEAMDIFDLGAVVMSHLSEEIRKLSRSQ